MLKRKYSKQKVHKVGTQWGPGAKQRTRVTAIHQVSDYCCNVISSLLLKSSILGNASMLYKNHTRGRYFVLCKNKGSLLWRYCGTSVHKGLKTHELSKTGLRQQQTPEWPTPHLSGLCWGLHWYLDSVVYNWELVNKLSCSPPTSPVDYENGTSLNNWLSVWQSLKSFSVCQLKVT